MDLPDYVESEIDGVKLRYNVGTGDLERRYENSHGEWWKVYGAGFGARGYRVIQINNKRRYTHRVIWEVALGFPISIPITVHLRDKRAPLTITNIYFFHPDTGEEINLEEIVKLRHNNLEYKDLFSKRNRGLKK